MENGLSSLLQIPHAPKLIPPQRPILPPPFLHAPSVPHPYLTHTSPIFLPLCRLPVAAACGPWSTVHGPMPVVTVPFHSGPEGPGAAPSGGEGRRDTGTLEPWTAGTPGHWNTGTLVPEARMCMPYSAYGLSHAIRPTVDCPRSRRCPPAAGRQPPSKSGGTDCACTAPNPGHRNTYVPFGRASKCRQHPPRRRQGDGESDGRMCRW
jgi:hypothetical protein